MPQIPRDAAIGAAIRSRAGRAVWRALGAGSAVCALGGCGGLEAETQPPTPRLTGSGASGAADFGSVTVGTSKRLDATLSNGVWGPEPYETLRDVRIAVEGPDLAFESNCPADGLPQASACTISVTWTPSSPYLLAGRLHVSSNAPSSPTELAITGIAAR